MNIAQLSEQLKDVPQPKLIDYARNPNSVVPQFLALAEIQRRQRLQITPQEPVRSTVAEDVLQQANPVPQMQPQMMAQGVPSLPSGMGQESFAGGGIVAFADGGETDDDEDALLSKEESSIMSLLAGLKERAMNPLARIENMPSRSQKRAMADVGQEEPRKRGSHKYEDAVIAEAKRQGVDPNLALHVLYKETGNLSNPENARSRAGALGVMQLMPRTAKELGVDPLDPMQNIQGGISYLKQMYKKYEDPMLAAAAYNAGPGRVDRALKGQGISTLPQETRRYIAGLAGGGIVAFAGDEESLVEDPEMVRQAYIDAELLRQKKYFDNLKQSDQADVRRVENQMKPFVPEPKKSLPPMQAKSSQADVRRVDNAIIEQQAKKKEDQKPDVLPPVADNAPTATIEKDPFAAYLARQEEARQALKKGAEEDKYLAILQAGLGMLGGTSPYAMANIGAGALQGVKGYGESKRARAAEALALDKAELGALRARELSDIKRAQMEQLADYRQGRLSQADEGKLIKLNATINNDPQIKSLEKRRQAENPLPGSPEDLYYDQAIEAIRRQRYKEAGVPYEYSTVALPAYPTKPKEPSWWEGLFGTGKPAQSSAPQPPAGFKVQQ